MPVMFLVAHALSEGRGCAPVFVYTEDRTCWMGALRAHAACMGTLFAHHQHECTCQATSAIAHNHVRVS